MRFDDSLATVLAADTASGFGAQSAWRQLVDLAGRRRVPDLDAAVSRLRELRNLVPTAVRAASGRTLAWGEPPLALVALFAEDELAIAAPVLRTARLQADEWAELLPLLTPACRSVLRHRRDLPDATVRGLASFGATDFVLGHDKPFVAGAVEQAPEPYVEPPLLRQPDAPLPPVSPTPFVAVGAISRALPVVAEAMRQATAAPQFAIADLVARIDAFRRERPATPIVPAPTAAPEHWQFETDGQGVIRWVEGIARGPLIGVSLAYAARQGAAQLDASAGGALRARAAFCDVRLEIAGDSSAAGAWRLAGVPRFDRTTGRFTGLAGTGRRPRREESAGPVVSASDSLRQLVHELRTPANAIAGFSELIGTELLGPVPPVYRDRAQLIQGQAAALIAAIDDLDTAARIDGDALDLRPAALDLAALVQRSAGELQPFAAERRATLAVETDGVALVQVDDRAAARLVDRLLLTALAVAESGENVRVHLLTKARSVRLHVTRPRALRVGAEDVLLAIDAEAEREGGPLLGVGFTLRLVRNLAVALGGSLAITPDRLTLRLPIAVTPTMEQAAAQ